MKKKSKYLINDPESVHGRTLDAQSANMVKTPFSGAGLANFGGEILIFYEKIVEIFT